MRRYIWSFVWVVYLAIALHFYITTDDKLFVVYVIIGVMALPVAVVEAYLNKPYKKSVNSK